MSEYEDSELDPRIQIELEKLNATTDEINRLEIEYDEANTTFRMLLNESTRRLKVLSNKLGSCIEKARPYYEALEETRSAQQECQKAAVQFQRASEIHAAAKETVALAEQRFMSNQHEWQFDNAWQEMLNHATIKVMEAENDKAESGREHQRRATVFKTADEKLKHLESSLQKSILKSRPYFDEKNLCQGQLNTQKDRIETIKRDIVKAKTFYSRTLKQLEQISNEIHIKRGSMTEEILKGPREPGVGAELAPSHDELLNKQCSLPSLSTELHKNFGESNSSIGGRESLNDINELEEACSNLNIRPVEGKSMDGVWLKEEAKPNVNDQGKEDKIVN